jgi:hypothetical protein
VPLLALPPGHVCACWRNCKRSVGNGAWREVTTFTVEGDDIAGSVDLSRVCIARAVDIVEHIGASPIGAGVTGRRYVERPPRKLALVNGSA